MSTLFIVPWLAAATRSGTACANAPKIASQIRCEPSTFPAPTAAGGRAAHAGVGVVGEGVLRFEEQIVPPRRRELAQTSSAARVRSGLRVEVTLTFVRRPGTPDDATDHVVVEERRREAKALLRDVRGPGG